MLDNTNSQGSDTVNPSSMVRPNVDVTSFQNSAYQNADSYPDADAYPNEIDMVVDDFDLSLLDIP